jgi:hypothetical protein
MSVLLSMLLYRYCLSQLNSIEINFVLKSFLLTPQGSAADVAMCAMLEIDRNTRLKELGWTLLLQVSDVLSYLSLVKCMHTLFFP